MTTYRYRIRKPIDIDQLTVELADFQPLAVRDTDDGVEIDVSAPTDSIAIERIIVAHVSDQTDQLDKLVEKAHQVWNGQGSFTQAQAQKILAGLVLLENRRR